MEMFLKKISIPSTPIDVSPKSIAILLALYMFHEAGPQSSGDNVCIYN